MKKLTYIKKTDFLSVFTILICIFFSFSQAFAYENKIKLKVETDHNLLLAGEKNKTIIKVTLDVPETPSHEKRSPVNMSLVLDKSGSMTGTKINQAKEGAIEALKRLGRDDFFSLVAYDTGVETIIFSTRGGYDQNKESKIRNIRAGGSTALFAGVSQGAAEIRKHIESDMVHRIILLSDGLANIGPDSPEDLGRLGAALAKENISVSTIGVGTGYNEDLMTRLSQKSDGNTYFAESARDLPSIFGAELGNTLNIFAKQIEVTISLPENVKPISIIGREGRIDKNRINISFNQLYGNQEKYILIEAEVDGLKKGKKMEVASAKAKYTNVYTKSEENVNEKGYVGFSKNRKDVKKSENISVLREYHLNLNAIAEERAISFADKGNRKEAVQELKSSAEKLRTFGNVYKDESVLKEADILEKRAEKIESEGMSNKLRKVLRTKSYQKKNQQADF